jgi:hypothetical protein
VEPPDRNRRGRRASPRTVWGGGDGVRTTDLNPPREHDRGGRIRRAWCGAAERDAGARAPGPGSRPPPRRRAGGEAGSCGPTAPWRARSRRSPGLPGRGRSGTTSPEPGPALHARAGSGGPGRALGGTHRPDRFGPRSAACLRS